MGVGWSGGVSRGGVVGPSGVVYFVLGLCGGIDWRRFDDEMLDSFVYLLLAVGVSFQFECLRLVGTLGSL